MIKLSLAQENLLKPLEDRIKNLEEEIENIERVLEAWIDFLIFGKLSSESIRQCIHVLFQDSDQQTDKSLSEL